MGNSIQDVLDRFYDNSLENIGEYNSFVWYGPRWAQAATAPSRLYKMYSTEGGIKVPMILNYPPWTQERGGEIVDAFGTVMDLMPTILDLANIQHPGKTFRGREVEEMRGKSWVKFFESGTQSGDTITAIHSSDDPAVGWELFGRAALRKGNWKIVYMTPWSHGKGEWELFDLSKDPGETRDLSAEEPGKLKELKELWEVYVKESGVVWGSPLNEIEVKVPGLERRDVIGGDPLEDTMMWTKAWMPPRGHCKD